MSRFIAPALALAVALSACGKKSESTGGGAAPSPPPASQSQPADPIDPARTGAVKGVVKLEGTPPSKKVPLGGIAYCAAQHPNGLPLDDSFVLGDGQTLANVLVYVKSGLGNRKFETPKDVVVLDQVGCLYTPHVCAVQTHQTFRVHNGDHILHNVHGKPQFNRPFNDGQMTKGVQNDYSFAVPEIGIHVKCDIHPWMKAYLHIVGHPFFKVTGKDGAFSLEGLPEGEYEIHAWHEEFKKPEVKKVKIEAQKTATQDFLFTFGK